MYKYIKRLLDIIISLILIILLFPIIIKIGLVVLTSLKLPIIFKQEREGKNHKIFTMYKFRTMKANINLPRKERFTKSTRILDKYKFNELAQLLNVIKGDMSLIGPRPFIPNEDLSLKPNYKRYLVKPGMTGLAQVNGGRSITHKRKLEYDIVYYDNFGFIQDFKILLKTIFAFKNSL
jgi:lipopolysaccharide/colanic/teichoic acid biosynthesis glycosyltransferase